MMFLMVSSQPVRKPHLERLIKTLRFPSVLLWFVLGPGPPPGGRPEAPGSPMQGLFEAAHCFLWGRADGMSGAFAARLDGGSFPARRQPPRLRQGCKKDWFSDLLARASGLRRSPKGFPRPSVAFPRPPRGLRGGASGPNTTKAKHPETSKY
jgi:hypothetical protein